MAKIPENNMAKLATTSVITKFKYWKISLLMTRKFHYAYICVYSSNEMQYV